MCVKPRPKHTKMEMSTKRANEVGLGLPEENTHFAIGCPLAHTNTHTHTEARKGERVSV